MAKICPITKRTSFVGGGYSNATRATQFNPTGKTRRQVNLQKKKIYVPELKKTVTMTLSTRAIKTIQKNGAYATLKKAGIIKAGVLKKGTKSK
ncbi:MAG: bL28 family ribosomal protein [bacterium]